MCYKASTHLLSIYWWDNPIHLSFRVLLPSLSIHDWIILVKLQTNAIHAMPFVDWIVIPLAFKDMTKMTTAIAAHYFGPRHAKAAIRVAGDGARYRIEVCRPSTSRRKFMRRLVQRGVAAGAFVDALGGLVLVILPSKWCFRTLLTEDTELLFALSVR